MDCRVEKCGIDLVGIKSLVYSDMCEHADEEELGVYVNPNDVWESNEKAIKKILDSKSCEKDGLYSVIHKVEGNKPYHELMLCVLDDSDIKDKQMEKIKIQENTWLVFESLVDIDSGVDMNEYIPKLYEDIYAHKVPEMGYKAHDDYAIETWSPEEREDGFYKFETWVPVEKLE